MPRLIACLVLLLAPALPVWADADSFAPGYDLIRDDGVDENRRGALNLTGAGVSCADDSANNETECDIGGASLSEDSTLAGASPSLIFDPTSGNSWGFHLDPGGFPFWLINGTSIAWLVDANNNFYLPSLANCDTIDSNSQGRLICGTDGGGGGNSFETIAVPAGASVVADSSTDTLTITETSFLTLTGTAATDTLDITQVTTDLGTDGLIAANAVALGTDTTNAYVTDLTAGTYIDVSGGGAETATVTVTVDPTEILDVTFAAGANASQIWTWDLSGTDPTLTAGSALLTVGGALTSTSAITGQNFTISGTAGAGWMDFPGQASNPAVPAAGTIRLHSSTANGFTRLEQDNEATTNIFLGRDSVTIAKNVSGGALAIGEVVYVFGSVGNVPTVKKAKADSITTLPATFVVVDAIADNAFGQVMRQGIISGFNTNPLGVAGTRIYVDATTAGALTATRPSGTTNFVQRVGTVLVQGVGNGSLDVLIAPAILNMETGTNAATWTGSDIALTGTGPDISLTPTGGVAAGLHAELHSSTNTLLSLKNGARWVLEEYPTQLVIGGNTSAASAPKVVIKATASGDGAFEAPPNSIGPSDLVNRTSRLPIINLWTIPDASGNVFFEPQAIKATNDVFAQLVVIYTDTATRDCLGGRFTVPDNYTSGANLVPVWSSTATSGDVEWDFDYRAVGGDDTESLDQAGNQQSVNSNDTAPSAAHERMEITIDLTDSNFAVSDEVSFIACRDGTDAGDTIAAAVMLYGLFFEYTAD